MRIASEVSSSRLQLAGLGAALLLVTAASTGRAQEPENIQAGVPEDCTFCRPWVFVEGGYTRWSDEALPDASGLGPEAVSEAFDEFLARDQVLEIAGQFIES